MSKPVRDDLTGRARRNVERYGPEAVLMLNEADARAACLTHLARRGETCTLNNGEKLRLYEIPARAALDCLTGPPLG